MERNTLAKAVVIIDTHATDNGYFAWKGTKDGYASACSLRQVRKASLPPPKKKHTSDPHSFWRTAAPMGYLGIYQTIPPRTCTGISA